MRTPCPCCHAEHCSDVRPDCRARNAETRLLYARANGNEMESLRAENETLRLKLARRRGR